MLSCGDTFLIPKRSDQIEHLWIVITDPDVDGKAVCVNITTRQPYSDTTVILKRGDHPFIRHESVAHYPDARILDLNAVQDALLKAGNTSFVCESPRKMYRGAGKPFAGRPNEVPAYTKGCEGSVRKTIWR